jgi:DNA-binding SARP family transcriptional activator
MRKPHVALFHSHYQENDFDEVFNQDFTIVSYPLDQAITKEFLSPEPSLAIICDASKEEQGIARMEEIKIYFPSLTLFLIVEDPSKAYLMAALRFKVSNFLTLPIKNAELRRSILQVANSNRQWNILEKTRHWLCSFYKRLSSTNVAVTEIVLKHEESKKQEDWDTEPHLYLHFPKTNPEERSHTYDMSVQFFGNLNIDVREKPIPRITGEKNTTIMAYLLFHHHRPTHREILMEQFWSDFTPSSAKNSLNVAICSLRKNLSKTFPGQEVIVYDQQSYGINPELKIITDTEKFIYCWKKGNTIESSQGLAPALGIYNSAVSYYKAEFLANLRFENWCEYERDNLKEIYLYILNKLGIHFFSQKQYDACINIGKKMLKEDICLEEVHRKMMKSYYLLGQTDLAHMQYFRCKKALQEELSLNPSEQTVELFNKIQNGRPVTF